MSDLSSVAIPSVHFIWTSLLKRRPTWPGNCSSWINTSCSSRGLSVEMLRLSSLLIVIQVLDIPIVIVGGIFVLTSIVFVFLNPAFFLYQSSYYFPEVQGCLFVHLSCLISRDSSAGFTSGIRSLSREILSSCELHTVCLVSLKRSLGEEGPNELPYREKCV